LLEAPGPFSHHRLKIIELGEPFFAKHGPKAVFLGRFVSGLRITAAWMAGITRMEWPIFMFYNALGGVVWASGVGLLAYYAGDNADKIIHAIGIGGVALVVVAGGGAWFYLHHRKAKDDDSAAAVAPDDAG
jgi:membrane protein DedA with SNARE-associated domain